jgi:hypothetical protein
MIITEPNDFVAEVHDRMRVILARNSYAKGALQNHICGFDSYMPSQPVRSLLWDFRVCENRRHCRGLGWRAGVSSRSILEFQVRIGGFFKPVSARHFPISVSACPRSVHAGVPRLLLVDADIFIGIHRSRLPSRPGEFHPEPLTDPDVNLSIHPARAIA